MRIAWKISSPDWAIANVRIRFWIPYLHLKQKHSIFIYAGNQEIPIHKKIDVMIFVKALQERDLQLARYFQAAGTKIVYDLCDYLFYLLEYYQQKLDFDSLKIQKKECQVLSEFLKLSDLVIVPTETLKTKLVEFGIAEQKIQVIIDAVDKTPPPKFISFRHFQLVHYLWTGGFRFFIYYWFTTISRWIFIRIPQKILALCNSVIHRLTLMISPVGKRILQKALFIQVVTSDPPGVTANNPQLPPPASDKVSLQDRVQPKAIKTLLWFGNSGREDLFGMTDLLLIRNDLEKLFQEVPFELVVISNNFYAYQKYIKPFNVKTRYMEWTTDVVQNQLLQTDVTLVPVAANPFSQCKSANRTILSLKYKCAVVASKNRSLDPLKDVVLMDDWYTNIKLYLQNPELRSQHLEYAQIILQEQYSQEVVAQKWESVLQELF